MRFDCISDLHVDHYDDEFDLKSIQQSENLIIAGDISDHVVIVNKFAKNARKYYDRVYFVDGNHEFRSLRSYSETIPELHKLASIDGVYYIPNGAPIVDNIQIIGINGWYDWQVLEPHIEADDARNSWAARSKDAWVDYSPYKNPGDLADNHSKLLRKQFAQVNPDSQIIVVTHTSPLSHKAKVRNDMHWDLMTPSYYNSGLSSLLQDDINGQISHWIFGHSHFPVDEIHNGIRFINNSRGYPHEDNGNYQVVQIEV